jgi:hypothetical protein
MYCLAARPFSVLRVRSARTCYASLQQDLAKEVDSTVKSHPCVVYMRGDAQTPRCKFSAAVVDALNAVGMCLCIALQ